MKFTDLFIRRPVLAIVVSALLLLLGTASAFRVGVREFPELERSVIEVRTMYRGASARTVQGFVTNPLQLGIAGARGIEYMTSKSDPGFSTIKVHVRLGENSSDVLSEVIAKVREARGDLPRQIEDPVVSTSTSGDALMYITFYSQQMARVGHAAGRRQGSNPGWEVLGHAHLVGSRSHGRTRRHCGERERRHSARQLRGHRRLH